MLSQHKKYTEIYVPTIAVITWLQRLNKFANNGPSVSPFISIGHINYDWLLQMIEPV